MPRSYTFRSEPGHRWYGVWYSMIQRCTNPKHPHYRLYKDRGVHPDWRESPNGFGEYLDKHLGPKPTPEHTLDRIDNDKGYIPGNLRWATWTEQFLNRKSTRRFEWNGELLTTKELSQISGIPGSIIYHRIRVLKWPIEIAMTTPPVPRNQRYRYGKALTKTE